ncbi:DUF1189 family protein [Listeria booriae]|uniref:DUF1189 family protein n=2 Tax=Listeria booriae TaxID=1552123 RepID=A0A7X0YIM9_9LIST|nr:DUF1189 family protein [Listeria booriae]MBC1332137.1 DUF1189 family protein [Listeria booriae]MBC2115136.1 DUF1189 family protein [Listeria booriae]MBC2175699.1 DUF1189 family protein [Listeria booriae]MBC2370500.1 DUF1189 family protein [Listeria booriae]MBC2387059.1 DUF1189 family protein [Listeria booriae]
MMKRGFPMDFFWGMCSPKRMFASRKLFGWGKLVIIFVFLTACLMIPVSLNFAKQDSFDLESLMPNMMNQVSDGFVDELTANYTLRNGTLSGQDNMDVATKTGVAMVNLDGTTLPDVKNMVVLGKSSMELRDSSGYAFTVKYTDDATLTDVSSMADMQAFISGQWYVQNKAFVFLTMVAMLGSVLFASSLMLALFAALFIWFTKRNQMSEIASYKEALSLTLLALGLPTIFAAVIGTIYFDITVMMAIQSLGMVLLIAFTFIKTRFRQTDDILDLGGRTG